MITLLTLLIYLQPTQALTFKEFITSFQENSQRLSELKSETDVSLYELKDAKSERLPKVNFNLAYRGNSQPASSLGIEFPGLNFLESKIYSAMLSVDQVIYSGGRISETISIKESQNTLARLMYQSQKQSLTTELLSMAIRWSFNKETIFVLQESLKMQTQFLSLVAKRQRAGLARRFDYDKALGDKTAYELRIEQLQQENDRLLGTLLVETGLNKEQLSQLTLPELNSLKVEGSVDQFEQNLFLKATLSEKALAKKQLALEKTQFRPNLTAGVGYGRESTDFSDLDQSKFATKSFYINLKVPLFSGFSRNHLRHKRKFKNYALEKKLKAAQRNLKVQALQIRDRLQKNQSLVVKSKQWKVAAERGLKRVLKSYKMGQVENSQVVLMQSDFERASRSYLDLIQLFYTDYIAWNSIQGNNIEDIF